MNWNKGIFRILIVATVFFVFTSTLAVYRLYHASEIQRSISAEERAIITAEMRYAAAKGEGQQRPVVDDNKAKAALMKLLQAKREYVRGSTGLAASLFWIAIIWIGYFTLRWIIRGFRRQSSLRETAAANASSIPSDAVTS